MLRSQGMRLVPVRMFRAMTSDSSLRTAVALDSLPLVFSPLGERKDFQ